MQQGPLLFIPPKNDVPSSAAITAIGTSAWIELSSHKMPATCSAMSTPAENPYIINKIIFFHSQAKLNAYL